VNCGRRIGNVRANEREREREICEGRVEVGLFSGIPQKIIFLHRKGKGKSAELWALFG
jgi:hypothetical protein